MGPSAIADAKCTFGRSLVVLGLEVRFKGTAAAVWPDEVKAVKWLASIVAFLVSGILGPGEASKLLGRLS